MTALGSCVYIYGGQEPSSGLCFGDVVQLDTDTWRWSPLKATSGQPPPRHAHCAGAVGDHSLVIYGGASQQHQCASAARHDVASLRVALQTCFGMRGLLRQ